MQTIGLLGGMSWQSTVTYYRLLNEGVAARLGGLHSARIVLHSVDFEAIEACQRESRWEDAGDLLADAARSVEAAGADFLLLCTNTMHRLVERIEGAIRIPLLHIADATADAALEADIQRVGLLGTRYTMEQDFYRGRLQVGGLEVLTPPEDDRDRVHRVIYDELCHGVVEHASRREFRRIIADLVDGGAEAVILGCTEIGLLVRDHDASVPVFDTTRLHVQAALKRAFRPNLRAVE